jgi:hypothetical protein
MGRSRVLVDTGPLVALLSHRDSRHSEADSVASSLPRPLVTTWLVLGEAAWLLRHTREGIPGLMRLVDEQVVECVDLPRGAANRIAQVAEQYADLEPQLADLSLVYLAETMDLFELFSFDRRDFAVYRLASGRLTLIPG